MSSGNNIVSIVDKVFAGYEGKRNFPNDFRALKKELIAEIAGAVLKHPTCMELVSPMGILYELIGEDEAVAAKKAQLSQEAKS